MKDDETLKIHFLSDLGGLGITHVNRYGTMMPSSPIHYKYKSVFVWDWLWSSLLFLASIAASLAMCIGLMLLVQYCHESSHVFLSIGIGYITAQALVLSFMWLSNFRIFKTEIVQ